MSEPKRYIATATGFLMVLRQGDDFFARLEALMRDEMIPSAFLSGLGFAGQVTFGFFDYEKKEYMPNTMHNLELTNLTGTLAWKNGEPSVHAHGTAGSPAFGPSAATSWLSRSDAGRWSSTSP